MSGLHDLDRELRAVRRGESGLLHEFLGDLALDQQDGLTEVVDIEQLWGQGITTVVALALVGFEMNAHVRTLCVPVGGRRTEGLLNPLH
jgi:hypothetical protein